LTLGKAASTAVAGDTVSVGAGGVYNEAVTPTHSGTSGNPITFIAATGTSPKVRLWQLANLSYITVNGFEVTNAAPFQMDGPYVKSFDVSGSTGIQILNNYIHDTSGPAIFSKDYCNGCSINVTTNLVVRGNTITKIGPLVNWCNASSPDLSATPPSGYVLYPDGCTNPPDLAASQNSTTLTSASGGFASWMVGYPFTITGGTNFVASTNYTIMAVTDSHTITLDRAPATAGPGSGGIGLIGRQDSMMEAYVTNTLIENNDWSLGGDPIDIFGHKNVIRNNTFHDFRDYESSGNQHEDAVQSYCVTATNAESGNYFLIEGNRALNNVGGNDHFVIEK
jgi:hypothetical protein